MVSKWASLNPKIKETIANDPTLVGQWILLAMKVLGVKEKNKDVDLFRTYLRRHFSETSTEDTTTKTETNQYDPPEQVANAWDSEKGGYMDIDVYCKHYNLPRQDVRSYKLVTHTGTPFYNIAFHENVEITNDITEEVIERVVKSLITPAVKVDILPNVSKDQLTRLIYTDAHIAMETNKNGFGLYGGKWNADVLNERKKEIFKALYKTSGELHLIDLGDFVDGWDGETVRKGHELPQNMDNEKAFEVGVAFKVSLVEALMLTGRYTKIVSHNVCNDNHAGSFGYITNHAARLVLEAKYPEMVEVKNYRKFIDHYTWKKHAFLLCHGKDSKHLKFGFKPHIDTKGIDKIFEYIKHHRLFAYDVTFEKGDSHQMLLDYTSSDEFDYFNYPALSPASEWVQTNYKKGRSGFVVQEISGDTKTITPYWFKWNYS